MPDNKQPKADFSDVEGGSSSTAPPAARTHTVVTNKDSAPAGSKDFEVK